MSFDFADGVFEQTQISNVNKQVVHLVTSIPCET